MAVSGSLHGASSTRAVIKHLGEHLQSAGCHVDFLDLHAQPLPLFSPDTSFKSHEYAALKPRVDEGDVFILGTPDYHGSISSGLKNFLDHFWKEFVGKLFVTVVASHEKGLTVHDQLRTIARQCYAWSMPYGVSFQEKEDVRDGQIVSEMFNSRLAMLVRDIRVYGPLLRQQRLADLAGSDPGFLARLRR